MTVKALLEAKRCKVAADNSHSVRCSRDDDHCLYFCDVCDEVEIMVGHRVAEEHLRESGHVSCSRYARLPDNGAKGSEKVELIIPRDIFVGEISGHREDDIVVFCPTCHLLTSDKVCLIWLFFFLQMV